MKHYSCLLLFIFCCFGCAAPTKPDGFPKLHPCELRFTMNGEPLEGAMISTISSEGRWPSGGATDRDGTVQLTTYRFSGVPEGEYKILVAKDGLKPTSTSGDSDTEELPPSLVHAKYAEAATTPLALTVKPGENRFEFAVDPPMQYLGGNKK